MLSFIIHSVEKVSTPFLPKSITSAEGDVLSNQAIYRVVVEMSPQAPEGWAEVPIPFYVFLCHYKQGQTKKERTFDGWRVTAIYTLEVDERRPTFKLVDLKDSLEEAYAEPLWERIEAHLETHVKVG